MEYNGVAVDALAHAVPPAFIRLGSGIINHGYGAAAAHVTIGPDSRAFMSSAERLIGGETTSCDAASVVLQANPRFMSYLASYDSANDSAKDSAQYGSSGSISGRRAESLRQRRPDVGRAAGVGWAEPQTHCKLCTHRGAAAAGGQRVPAVQRAACQRRDR